jgi:hypothetical protein
MAKMELKTEIKFQASEFLPLSEIFQYSGYNPLEFIKVLTEKEPNKEIFEADMFKLVCFYVLRGARPDRAKVSKRMPEAGLKELTRLMAKYRILTGRTDRNAEGPKDKNEVVMSRIVGCFPITVCAAMEMGGRVVGDRPSGLPKALCFPGAPALIPFDRPDIFNLWKQWSSSFSKVIGTSPDKQAEYSEIVWKSSPVPDQRRKEVMKHFSL